MARTEMTQDELEALQKKHEFYKGKVRYLSAEGTVLPEQVGSKYWTDPNHATRRQICIGLSQAGQPVWRELPDAPEAPRGYDPDQNTTYQDEHHLIEATPPFTHTPAAYNSDTLSGGPANFHGNAGGDDNPRNPELEGEVPGQHASALDAFAEKLEQSGIK